MAICKRRIISSTSTVLSGGNVVVTFPSMTTVRNCDVLRLVIAQPIPTAPATARVIFVINGVSFTVYTKYHNYLRPTQLCRFKINNYGVGANTTSLTVLSCVGCSSESFATFPPPTTVVEPEPEPEVKTSEKE